ncbi:hypothetical protein KFZ70_12255 [Tamlana fucoidanivorans]|uniref:Glycosyl hydrolases family 2 sugar binding domain-containing protein n=1 Tax=Allotamlana fucoidanivorans TaxID=2583814 RepID=A0A5C4SN00_9FLAO|nr:glycosylhydrolase-like jelly roll fold domain-containing protein [Tamlana fucoidanivorans]TNJ44950.1 hypothetical protein FGF67_07265 [Tamlana fucoidanivorans]
MFENEQPEVKSADKKTELVFSKEIQANWTVEGKRVDGKNFTWNMDALQDFSASKDKTQNTFAGTIIYKTKITVEDAITHLDLGNVNEGITELYVNGKKVAKRWYGRAMYPVSDVLEEGENAIEIHYTTVLSNYCLSLDIPAVNRWTNRYKNEPLTSVGLEGPIKLIKYE